MKSKQLMKKASLLMFLCVFVTGMFAQNKDVKGNVTDSYGDPLPGVTVVVKGTTRGTITDIDGNYVFSIGADDKILEFSFIGLKTQEIIIGNQININVKMVADQIGLDEVVAVGYGVRKKSDVISSVVSVKPESLTNVPSTDVGEMLRGKASGVRITLNNGGPGSSSKIEVRGVRTLLNSDNQGPIIIADGVQIGSINDVSVNDIAGIEILKDAAAQAIYGARASNGVVLITTKRGKAGKTSVDYNGFYGVQSYVRNFDIYNGEEYAQLKMDALTADNYFVPNGNNLSSVEQEVYDSKEFVNWEDQLLVKNAVKQNHNVSISSGNETARVYSSFNYTNQDGVVPGTSFEKMAIRLNADVKLNDWASLGVNTSWQISQKNDPSSQDIINRSITTSPLSKIYDAEGNYLYYPSGTDVEEQKNPLIDLNEVSKVTDDRNDIMNVFFDFKPFKNFKYRLNTSRRSWNQKFDEYKSSKSYAGITSVSADNVPTGLGKGTIKKQDVAEYQIENILTYDFTKDIHSLNFTAVQSLSEKKYTYTEINAEEIPNDELGMMGLETAGVFKPETSGNSRSLLSFVGRVQYDFNSKYYLTLSARADASSVFGDNNKWGYFPAAAIGWNAYREAFIENIEVISNLKLRASYGSVGNEAIDPYQSRNLAEYRPYFLNDTKVAGYRPSTTLANPNLKWETSTTLNTAVDFGFWNNRLSGTVELYQTITTDLLVERSLPSITGYSKIYDNIGEIENKGLEFNLQGVIVDNKDWTVSTGVTFSANKNKINKLFGDLDGDGKEDDYQANGWFIGEPISVYHMYVPVGIWQVGDDIANSHQPTAIPGDVRYYDADPTDGIKNVDDKMIFGKYPKWYGSFNLSVNYKAIDFSADVVTVQGILKANSFLENYNKGGNLQGKLNGVKVDYWTPNNPTGDFPSPHAGNGGRGLWEKSITDASYIRLQNITIGYSLPKAVLKNIGLSKVRFYATAHNLLTLTDYKSYSPEKDANDYPEMVSYVGGLQVSF